ncbi:dienelactone hydrolase family-domain-containing protein [Flammula alnicola]|nr:dienelactone hydrolase family-domain-containing protein [Flammula alnicola]
MSSSKVRNINMSTSSTSPVLAGSVGECCVKGFKHEGEPVGRIETIADIRTYVSGPPANTTGPKKVILFFSDVYGPLYINAKLLQDYFASQGFHVMGLDYFFGDYMSDHTDKPGFEVLPWIEKKMKTAQETTPKWIDAVRKIYGEDAIYFSTGYCFGGPFTVDLAATDKVAADEFRNLKKPLLLSCAETDQTFPTEARHRAENILAEIKATYHVQVYSGVSHGFATRGDISVENIRWAREQSAQNTINWFKRFSVTSS